MEDLHSVPELNTLFLALFAFGIGIGGFLCNRLFRGEITLKYTWAAALGMAVSALVLSSLAYCNPPVVEMSLPDFLMQPYAPLMLMSIIVLAASAGIYVVPIVSKLQLSVPEDQRARLLSLANIWFALFVLASSLLAAAVIALGGAAKTVFGIIGLLTLFLALYSYRKS